MSGGGGGSQTQMQTPWSGLQPYLGGSADTPGLYSLGYQNYLNRADGSAYAPVNHSQLAAQQMTLDNAMNVMPGIGAAYGDIMGRLVGSTGTGPLQGNYSSPYAAPAPVQEGTTASAVVPQKPGPEVGGGGVGGGQFEPGDDGHKGGSVHAPVAGSGRPTFGISAPGGAPGGATTIAAPQTGGGDPLPSSVSPRPVYAGITAGGQRQPFSTQAPGGPTAPGAATQIGPRPAVAPAQPMGIQRPGGRGPQSLQSQKPGIASQPGFKPYIGDNEGGNSSNGGDNSVDGGFDGNATGAGGDIADAGASAPNAGENSGMNSGGGGDSDPSQGVGAVTSEEGVTMPSTAHGNRLAESVYRPVSHSQMQQNMPSLGTPTGGNQGSYNFGGQGVERVGLSPVTGGVDFAPVGGELGLPSRENMAQHGTGFSNSIASMRRTGMESLDRLAAAGDPGNNPYLQQQVQGMADLVNRNLSENILPGIADQSAGAGMASSSRRGIAEGIAARGASEEIARQAAGMYGQAYRDSTAANQAAASLYSQAAGQQSGVDTARMGLGVQQRGQDLSAMLQGRGQDISQNTALAGLGVQQRGQDVSQNTALAGLGLQQRQQDLTSLNQAAAMLPNLADMYMMPASMVESVGQQQQAQTQEQLDAPYRALMEYSGILGQGGQYTNTTTPLYRNRLGSAAGGAMAGMQMGGPWGAAIGGAMGYMAG